MDTSSKGEQSYQRLAGSGNRRVVPDWLVVLLFFVIGIFALLLRGNRVRLWKGKDHLLLVEWDGYRERYKRFRYSDIQTLIIQRTSEHIWVTATCAFLLITFLVFVLIAGDLALQVVLGIIAAVWAILLTTNLVAGPMCRCLLNTAVQTEELASLRRLKNARRALDELRPMILQAQGDFPSAPTETEVPTVIPEPTVSQGRGSPGKDVVLDVQGPATPSEPPGPGV